MRNNLLVWTFTVGFQTLVSCLSPSDGYWGNFGECSRTCGGGIQSRYCQSNKRGTESCQGDLIDYRSCNIQECPINSGDFRAAQCAEYDSIPLDGKLYKWLPYYEGNDESAQCQLYCAAEGNPFYQKMADKVIDGTPCGPDTKDVCVDGQCKSVGCDGVLGSKKMDDNCGVCDGRDHYCKTVTGTIGHKGHNKVLRIPANARTIKITSHEPGQSYLAIQQGTESLILDRNIGDGKVMLSLAGVAFKYYVSDQGKGTQKLTASGPTNDTLVISIIKQDEDHAVYHYQYSLVDRSSKEHVPDGRATDSSRRSKEHSTDSSATDSSRRSKEHAADSSATDSRYAWLTGHWTTCSTPCGEGIQRRAVSCMDTKSPKVVTPQYCNGVNPPPSQQKCIGKICDDSAALNVQWDKGDWGPCSTSCEIGDQSMPVFCKAVRSDGSSFITSDQRCIETYKVKPQYMRSCNEEVRCPEWQTTPWSKCSKDCGMGEKSRRTYCQGTDSAGRTVILDSTACSMLDRPLESISCIENLRCDETGSSERREPNCLNSVYGCCPDGVTPARGFNGEGCSRDSSDVCLKDKETGPCSNYTIRWFYNKDQKGCRQFWYGGCNAGANNFETREDCQKKCEETKSGSDGNEGEKIVAAQCRQNEDRGPCTQYKVQWYYNYNEKRCQRFWYGGCRGNTNRFDNEEMCKSTCTSSSVIETTTPKPVDKSDIKDTGSTDICQLPNDMGKCREFKVKWFHNATARECGRFWYGGCEGNGNNFNSREDCEARCIQKVTTFAPITTTKPGKCPRLSIANIGACVRECQVDQDCSGNQKCCSNGCGMTCQDPGDSYLLTPPVDIKADMVSTGIAFVTWTDVQAADAVERRFYSVRYKAVGDSRYETLNTTAQQVYVTGLQPNQQYEFSVKVIQGTKYSLWSISAYNRTLSGSPIYKTGECPALRQGEGGICVEGCSNDYDCSGDMKCCSNGCGRECVKPEIVEVAPEPTLAPQPAAHYCTQESLRGPCQNYTVNWYFSPQDGRCRRFWYGGCDGNQNNFKTEADCDAACRRSATVEDVCQLPEVPGPCKAAHRKWYHDQSARECREFIYGGCRGNQNNFNTRAECLIRCGSDETKLKVNGLRAMNKSWNKVTLEWDPPVMAKEVRQYRLSYMGERYYRDQVQRDSVSVLDIPGSVSSYSINGLKPATQYRFNLTAITGNGQRGPTEQIITNTMSQNEYKDGECPRVDINSNINENCDRLCQTDYDCDGDYKCCRDRCGMSCQAPRVRESSGLCVDAQYGCCLDGVTAAQGPNYQGCPDACQGSKYGCCDDGVTSATGPNQDGCEIGSGDEDNFCEQSVFKCCADGITPAQGPNKEGCVEYVPPSTPKPDLGPVCQQAPKRGPCTDYKVKYFYNTTISRCDRFWYGGCDGNNNNFDSDEDCQAACVKKEVTLRVCEQPKQTGKCRGYIKRFYFNKDTEQCEEFIYGGCDGNDNNFENEVDCQRKCAKGEEITSAGNRCQLSADVGPCKGNIKRWYYNSQNGECVEFGWGGCEGNLNNFIDKETCLSKCSVQILPADKEPRDICRLPSEVGRCRASVQRWFYDFNEGKCKQFIYGGCDGNENNFETRELCESGCSRAKVCQPYYVPAIQCLAYIRRYQYIAASQDCQEFIYGGCGGNSNNFATIEACRGKCVESEPKTYDNICALKPEAGPCRERNIKWFYNTTTSRCEKFIYGGCHGNPNKFDSQDECDSFCTEGSGDIDVEVTSVDSSYCHLPKESGECENSFPAWYYDHLDGVCKEFVFGGCGGNKNRFTSREVCESSCSREAVCKLQPQQGDCGDNFRRYYHDARSGQCKEFLYNGCKGNANNFGTREACGNKCGDAYEQTDVRIPWDICRQPKDYGTCTGHEVKYYFDTAINDCRPFWYSTCGGNNNRFSDPTECRQRCLRDSSVVTLAPVTTTPVPLPTPDPTSVIIIGSICQEKDERGPCSNYTVKWYYNKITGICERFWYGGCEGNGNRFESQEACQKRCMGQTPEHPRSCQSSPWGCCPDGVTEALDFYFSNCKVQPGDTGEELEVGDATQIVEQPDRNVFIECRGPKGTVSWYKNRYIITSDGHYTIFANGSMLITSLTKEDSGVYACSIDYGGKEPAVQRFRIQVEVPITIFPTPSSIVLKPGETAILSCQAQGNPEPTITWNKDGQSIRNSERYYSYTNGTLVITNVELGDTGDYTCTARNGQSSVAQKLIRLTLRESVSAKIKPANSRLREGETLYLTCDGRGYPAPAVRWEKLGVQLFTTDRMTVNGGNLRITNVKLDDTGLYKCVASNEQEKSEDDQSIQVIPKDTEIANCVDSASVTMCRLIVRAGLCDYTMYSTQCCYSCDHSKRRG